MNRNIKKAKGYYYIEKIKTPNVEEKKYTVTYDETGIHLSELIDDPPLKAKIENFQFFVQYGSFQKLDQYKNLHKMYNPEVPMYELEYQLTNEDPNVKELRQRYDIPTDKAPTLLLKSKVPSIRNWRLIYFRKGNFSKASVMYPTQGNSRSHF